MAPGRILVTGGAGFLGSHLCDRLVADGHHVVCVDDLSTGARANIEGLLGHAGFDFQHHDILERLSLEIDQIYHLACPASPIQYQIDPVRTIRTAVEGTRNALDLARQARARILIASTSEVYGDPLEQPQRESYWGHVNPIGPRSCYDEGKRCAESLAVAYGRQFGVEVRIARIFNTYGPRIHEDDGRVVSNFIVQALRGRPITIFGDGRQTRSFCYVSDLIEGLVRLMASEHGPGPVNLGNPRDTTMLELADIVKRTARSHSELSHAPLPEDDPVHRKPDIARARELLRMWSPIVSLEDGIALTVEDFRRRLALS